MPIAGMLTRWHTLLSCASAIARIAGPLTPPLPAPSHGAPLRGSSAMPLSVLTSETASAPWACAASATAAGSVALGVSFTISGFSVSGRRRSTLRAVSSGSAPMIRPVSTLGHEKLSSMRAISGLSAVAVTSSASSSRLKPITETHRGTGSSASWGRSSWRNLSRPLFGRPIELISPAGVSHRRGGGLPWRGASVIVLLTKASNGNSSSTASPKARRAAMASKVPEPLRMGPFRWIPQRSIEPSGAITSVSRSRNEGCLELGRVEHGAVDTEALVAVLRRHDAAEAGAVAARHPGLERELGGHVALGREGAHGFEHRRRAAGEDRCIRVLVELLAQQLGDERPAPDRAVVGDHERVGREEQPRGLGVGTASESEQDARLCAQLVLQRDERCRTDAAADEQRAPSRRRAG